MRPSWKSKKDFSEESRAMMFENGVRPRTVSVPQAFLMARSMLEIFVESKLMPKIPSWPDCLFD